MLFPARVNVRAMSRPASKVVPAKVVSAGAGGLDGATADVDRETAVKGLSGTGVTQRAAVEYEIGSDITGHAEPACGPAICEGCDGKNATCQRRGAVVSISAGEGHGSGARFRKCTEAGNNATERRAGIVAAGGEVAAGIDAEHHRARARQRAEGLDVVIQIESRACGNAEAGDIADPLGTARAEDARLDEDCASGVVFPATTSNPVPVFVKVRAPPDSTSEPFRVRLVAASTCTVVLPARVIGPNQALSLAALRSAPVPPTPVPSSVSDSFPTTKPATDDSWRVAPLATTVPWPLPEAPRAAELPIWRMPWLTLVTPEKLFAPLSSRVPVPAFEIAVAPAAAVPEMLPDKVAMPLPFTASAEVPNPAAPVSANVPEVVVTVAGPAKLKAPATSLRRCYSGKWPRH